MPTKNGTLFLKSNHLPAPKMTTSFSEALILASTNTQYDKKLFIELQSSVFSQRRQLLNRVCCVVRAALMAFLYIAFDPSPLGWGLLSRCINT